MEDVTIQNKKEQVKTKQCNHKNTEIREAEQTFNIKNKEITVNAKRRYCKDCDELVYDDELDNSLSLQVISEYNKLYGVTPADIKKIREKYSISQETLSKILGCTKKTITMYENGQSIPNDVYRTILISIVKDEKELLRYARINSGSLTEKERRKLFENKAKEEELGLDCYYEDMEPSKENGFMQTNVQKLINTIIYFTMERRNKTVLAKMLFYLEFNFFRKFGTPVIGLPFLKMNYGPMPKHFHYVLDDLDLHNVVNMDIEYFDQYEYHVLRANKEFNSDIFSEEEMEMLAKVLKHFRNFNSSTISEISHLEKGWINTKLKKTIDYNYALEIIEIVE